MSPEDVAEQVIYKYVKKIYNEECEKCKKEIVFASAIELEKASGVKVVDLHKDIVDQVNRCQAGRNRRLSILWLGR